jgi:hypothetical protein
MTNIRDAAMGFEAVKISMSQDRNGIVLRLNIHPNDCPPELHTDWVGTRYMVAMVRLNDHDEPETREEQQRIERMIASAGLLCRNAEFGELPCRRWPYQRTRPLQHRSCSYLCGARLLWHILSHGVS